MQRKTSQRSAIEQVFLEEDRPLGIDEILQQARARVASLNLATVYRNLKLLIDKGWLSQISHPTMGTLYERSGKGHHHHHEPIAPIVREEPKINRNDPCTCGSGKKYKKCCGA